MQRHYFLSNKVQPIQWVFLRTFYRLSNGLKTIRRSLTVPIVIILICLIVAMTIFNRISIEKMKKENKKLKEELEIIERRLSNQ